MMRASKLWVNPSHAWFHEQPCDCAEWRAQACLAGHQGVVSLLCHDPHVAAARPWNAAADGGSERHAAPEERGQWRADGAGNEGSWYAMLRSTRASTRATEETRIADRILLFDMARDLPEVDLHLRK